MGLPKSQGRGTVEFETEPLSGQRVTLNRFQPVTRASMACSRRGRGVVPMGIGPHGNHTGDSPLIHRRIAVAAHWKAEDSQSRREPARLSVIPWATVCYVECIPCWGTGITDGVRRRRGGGAQSPLRCHPKSLLAFQGSADPGLELWRGSESFVATARN